MVPYHALIQKLLSERVLNSANVFFFEGERFQVPLEAGQYRPASEKPLKWRFAGGPMMAQHNTLNARLKDLLFYFSGDPDQFC